MAGYNTCRLCWVHVTTAGHLWCCLHLGFPGQHPYVSTLWPDYRKYLSPEILHIPYKWFAPQTPLKKIRKIREKIQAKAIQGHVPWLNLKKKMRSSFSQYTNNVGTPLFRSMRQAQITDTHALNQLGVSQNSSPLWSNFTADKHIWHPPWAWI